MAADAPDRTLPAELTVTPNPGYSPLRDPVFTKRGSCVKLVEQPFSCRPTARSGRPGRSWRVTPRLPDRHGIIPRPTNPHSRNILHVNGSQWTFLSNHGHVLVSLARDPDTRTRDVAEAVGITERAVQQIVHDLVEQGYVEKMKVGRRNRYTVVRGAHLRHQQVSRVSLGEFLDLLVPPTPAPSRRPSKK